MAIHQLTLCVFPISARDASGAEMASATGFFWRNSSGKLFLVTNWHVFTGRNHKTPKEAPNLRIPKSVQIVLHDKIASHENSVQLSKTSTIEFEINDEHGNSPKWIEHNLYRHQIDLVALMVDEGKLTNFIFRVLSDIGGWDRRLLPEVMSETFVVGFPWGLGGGGRALPLYKRGSVASEARINAEGLPLFYIDCWATSGMSGSPVIVRQHGFWNPDETGIGEEAFIGTVSNLVGIYSGRLVPISKLEATSEIGKVWRIEALNELVENGEQGISLDQIAKL
jgi:hypothetical protein